MSTHTTELLLLPYACDACGEGFCERVSLMNLSLGLTEQGFCLACLSTEYGRTPEAMAAFCWDYVKARDCFLDPWQKVDASECPKLFSQSCFCQHSV
ncbi:MAG: hypothetical protein QE263_09920 [Vampirovibrionales bacterium]|nr:hypothetical protein [Vampirovibrionales bacterium]